MVNGDGSKNPKTKKPFIMKPAGVAHIFGPGRVDGPFSEHYEPLECPVGENPMNTAHLLNPTVSGPIYSEQDKATPGGDKFPLVATTYRVSEHWQTGVMTRHSPWLLEMVPEVFVEMSKELAAEMGIKNGEKVMVESARGSMWAKAMVTLRMTPFTITGKTVHQVGLPWHFGWQFPEDGSSGESANLLTPGVGDPNTLIPETKAFMVNIKKM